MTACTRPAIRARPIPALFAEPSRRLEIALEDLAEERDRNADAIWTVLDPTQFASAGGATLHQQPDGSLLASGNNPSPDTYEIVASTN